MKANVMKRTLVTLFALLAIISQASAETPFQITGLSAEPMTKANLCGSLGGNRKPPNVVISHSKIAGVKIRVKMFDDTSKGSHIDHRSTTVVSNASGSTTLRYAFLPPCNRTGSSTSNYSISAEAGASKKQIVFGRYDSAKKRVFK
jgi:hypothetical protein